MISTIKSLRSQGFTIVELIIIIAIIGILAGIVIVSYNGLVDKSQTSKSTDDVEMLTKAIAKAQRMSGKTLMEITGTGYTAYQCTLKPTGTDLAALNKDTDPCWTSYKNFIAAIGLASDTTVALITDPWGRPYLIDENEGEFAGTPCRQDGIGVYSYPYVSGQAKSYGYLPFFLAGC